MPEQDDPYKAQRIAEREARRIAYLKDKKQIDPIISSPAPKLREEEQPKRVQEAKTITGGSPFDR